MLGRLLANSLLLLTSVFAQMQLLRAVVSVPNRTPYTNLITGGGEEREKTNSADSGTTAALAAGSRFSYPMPGGPSERRLVTPITGTASLQTAIGAWCDDSQTAAETYGGISTWCVTITFFMTVVDPLVNILTHSSPRPLYP
jgi:hypothetical protein